MEPNDLIENLILPTTMSPFLLINSRSSSSSRFSDYIQPSSTLYIDESSSSLLLPTSTSNPTQTNSTDQESRWLQSEPLLIPVTVLYILILLAGVIGNISTCIVIARNKYMRTATNYYLFSLAISDLLLLICGLPQELYLLWRRRPYIFGEFFCIIRGLSSETSSNASVLTITAFTIERYLAICHPLKAHTMSKLSRVIRLIIFIWICALLGALPLALQFGLKYDENIIDGSSSISAIESTAECTVISPIKHSFAISSLIFFIIPSLLLTVLYLSIGLHLRQSEALKRNQPDKCNCCSWFKCRSQLLKSATQGLRHSPSIHSNNVGEDENEQEEDEGDNNNCESKKSVHSSNNFVLAKYHTTLLTRSSSLYSKFKPSPPCIRYTDSRSPSNHHLHNTNPHHHSHNKHNNQTHLHHSHYPHHHYHNESSASSSSRRAVIKMLVAVVVAFFMCWAPFHAQRLMATYASGSTQAEIVIYNLLTYISGITYYLSTTINPVLYSIMSIKFRSAFKETLGSCCRKSTSDSDLGKFARGSRSSSRFNSTLKSTLGPETEIIIGPSDSFNGSFTRH
ncbi:pyrokinin-1 receptor-like isoform X1 [Tetranychus urticae]|uniref:pyrokinin-1 receptor-like isoform X1 n=1 Tax=Tetranychus urticae TaxID=32264 RepID=UPI00077BEE7F|nr:pyrokinin-1 receptor-like isoform X1 [Tetranychus urticae]